MSKYKNLLDKLNDFGERENKFKEEISKLRTQLKDKEIVININKNNSKDFAQDDFEFEDEK